MADIFDIVYNPDDEGDSDDEDMDARVYRRRIHPLDEFGNRKFRKRFRVNKPIARALIHDFHHHVPLLGDARGGAVSIEDRFCLALRYLATGANFSLVADYQGVSISTVSRSVTDFVDYMYTQAYRFIHWPETDAEKEKVALDFFVNYGLPRVLGCIDGTHVAIRTPVINEAAYVNRKGYHSINCMIVCESRKIITHVNPMWAGSVQDAYCYNASEIRAEADEDRLDPYFLLGDSGYGCKPNLFTPVRRPVNPPDFNYNDWHRRTRVLVEGCIGQLKQRWRCLDNSGGYLYHQPVKAAKIIIACCVLHNICQRARLPMEFDHDRDGFAAAPVDYGQPDQVPDPGEELTHKRQLYINRHFV